MLNLLHIVIKSRGTALGAVVNSPSNRMTMKSKKVTFENAEGHKLSARIELPVDERPHAFALFSHCFTCSKSLTAVRQITRALAMSGFGTLSFDFTGLGDSEGEFEATNFSTNISDLVAAAQFLEVNYEAPSLLVGHSLGGTAIMHASELIPSARAVVTVGSPYQPKHVAHLFTGSLEDMERDGQAEVSIGGRPFCIQRQFVQDIESKDSATVVKGLGKAFLIFHSPQDRVVGIDNAADMYAVAKHPKSFVSLDGADHLLMNKADAEYVGEVIASWTKRYIPVPSPESVTTESRLVASSTENKFTVEIQTGSHRFLGDEPLDVDGHDAGPTPYDFLLASLGTCTTMTVKMYADFKKIPYDQIRTHVSHQKAYAHDQKAADGKGQQIDELERKLEVTGDLTDQQREKLLQIADKCPVHRTFERGIQVKTDWLEPNS